MKRYIKSAIKSISDEDIGGLLTISNDPSVRPSILSDIARIQQFPLSYDLVMSLVSNPRAPEDVLARFADCAYKYQIHVAIAKNPSATEPVLKKLAALKEASTDRAILKNPNTPEALRKKIEKRRGLR